MRIVARRLVFAERLDLIGERAEKLVLDDGLRHGGALVAFSTVFRDVSEVDVLDTEFCPADKNGSDAEERSPIEGIAERAEVGYRARHKHWNLVKARIALADSDIALVGRHPRQMVAEDDQNEGPAPLPKLTLEIDEGVDRAAKPPAIIA